MRQTANNQNQQDAIVMDVDGGIIETFGEKLYKDKKKAGIRELMQNAWDADAQEVHIRTFLDDIIVVEDDGSGMDREGIDDYLTIGGSEKKDREITPIYKRPVIGRYGIGKFASFNLGERFIIETKKGDFEGKITLNKNKLMKEEGELKVDYNDQTSLDNNGTKIIIDKLKDEGNNLTAKDVKSIILRTCSQLITADNFNVYINGELIELDLPEGGLYPIDISHDFKDWKIEGEILVADSSLRTELRGIQQQHNGMTIKNGMMGLQRYNHITKSHRLYGRVSADFLDITAGRDDFVESSKEYEWFYSKVRERIIDILDQYRIERQEEEIEEDKETLKDVLNQAKDIFDEMGFEPPEGEIEVSHGHSRRGDKSNAREDPTRETREERYEQYKKSEEEKGEYDKTHTSTSTAERAMSELIEDTGIAPEIEALGENQPEVIYDPNPAAPTINMSHPLYKQAKNNDNLDFYFMKLIARIQSELNSKEIPEAFEKHSNVLKNYVKIKESNI